MDGGGREEGGRPSKTDGTVEKGDAHGMRLRPDGEGGRRQEGERREREGRQEGRKGVLIGLLDGASLGVVERGKGWVKEMDMEMIIDVVKWEDEIVEEVGECDTVWRKLSVLQEMKRALCRV